jgi:putative ABC transport system permease protein
VFTVIGVVRDEMHVNAFSDIWVPVTSQPSSDYKNQLFGGFMAMMMARSPEELPALKKEIMEMAKTVQYDDPNQFNLTRMWGDSKLALFARTLLSDQTEEGGAASCWPPSSR